MQHIWVLFEPHNKDTSKYIADQGHALVLNVIVSVSEDNRQISGHFVMVVQHQCEKRIV